MKLHLIPSDISVSSKFPVLSQAAEGVWLTEVVVGHTMNHQLT